jgi:AraC-like DNA-binding protein
MLDAFVQLQRFSRLMVDLGEAGPRYTIEWRGADLWLVDHRARPDEFPEHTEIGFAQMVTGSRAFGVDPFTTAVRLAHADPGYRGEYERILGAPVTFGAHENAMLLEKRFLMHPIARQPRYAFAILSEHAERMLGELERAQTVRGRVEHLLMPALHTGAAGMDAVAARLGVSRRTLHRQLEAEGTSFAEVLDALRHQLALHYLAGERVSVNETAYLVGFSDPAAFSRAFKRWTGRSPRSARRA